MSSWLTVRSLIYSVRNDFTGFAIAALIDCTQINIAVMHPKQIMETINGAGVILIL
jgi:hypothetical protein